MELDILIQATNTNINPARTLGLHDPRSKHLRTHCVYSSGKSVPYIYLSLSFSLSLSHSLSVSFSHLSLSLNPEFILRE
jgi:hypothetical protein